MISQAYLLATLLGATVRICSGAAVPIAETASLLPKTVWQPAVGATWQIMLSSAMELQAGALTTTPEVSIFDLDLFGTDASTISSLHNMGKKVVCYFSAGTSEPWTPDFKQFKATDLGSKNVNWPQETWLDTNSDNVRAIMAARISIAQQKGCDGVDPDNVDAYNNGNGLDLTKQDAVDYVQFLAGQASSHGLSIGLKNALGVLPQLSDSVQFAVNEACATYQECGLYSSFLNTGKPVFHIEYPQGGLKANQTAVEDACSPTGSEAVGLTMSTILKNTSLDGKVQFCDGSMQETPST